MPTGTHVIRGMAWSGDGAVVRVEVTTDGLDTWHDAGLGPSGWPTTWTPWQYAWRATSPGERVAVRVV